MKYQQVIRGRFESRLNRFIAKVWIGEELTTVHVKNTGRCKELLIPGVRVILAVSDNPARKTKYDLVTVYKEGLGWVNIDSQAPNQVVKEWLFKEGYSFIKSEYVYGESRLDFYMERERKEEATEEHLQKAQVHTPESRVEKFLMEVKGCTLEIDGVGYFPDAPTERGVKHLKELTKACREGYHAILAFVIAMEGVYEALPNVNTHPEFGEVLEEAMKAGVEVYYLCCKVTEDSLEIIEKRSPLG